jgi:putative DNA primase/helicase
MQLLKSIEANLKPPANDDAPISLAGNDILIHPRALRGLQKRDGGKLNGGQAPVRVDQDEKVDGQASTQDARTGGGTVSDDEPKPTTIKPIFDNFPAELTALPNWVMWLYINSDKVPFQPNGEFARSDNSATWNTFDACQAAYNSGKFDGIGFVFDGTVKDDGRCYVGISFDNCIENGKLVEPARSRIEPLYTYTEISESGTGVHCIVRAKPGNNETSQSVEICSKGQYFPLTGVPLGEACASIRSAATELDALAEEVRLAARGWEEPRFINLHADFVGPPFPIDVLPPTLANFVRAVERSMGVDQAAIAMSALAALAGALHADTRIYVGEDWWERPSDAAEARPVCC